MTSQERTTKASDLARLLASALGEEKSNEIILSAARALGLVEDHFTAAQAHAIFDRLANNDGLIGVVARFVIARGDVERLVDAPPPPESTRTKRRPSVPPPRPSPAGPIDLLPLLAPALGIEKARDVTFAAAARLRLDPHKLKRDQALAVLDELAANDGIVGVVARFAKAHFLLSRPPRE